MTVKVSNYIKVVKDEKNRLVIESDNGDLARMLRMTFVDLALGEKVFIEMTSEDKVLILKQVK